MLPYQLMSLRGDLLSKPLTALGFDPRTIDYIKLDLFRLWARCRNHGKNRNISSDKLHLGCGWKHVKGWLNCDVTGSDIDLDLASPPFPFADGQFSVIVAQQVVEHLDYDPVLLNLLRELHRILKPGGRVWLSCPDLEIICRSYCQDRCAAIDKGRKRHWPHGEEPGFPVQHRINYYFHHQGEHRNLYDLEMLEWALGYAGFKDVRRVDEGAFYREHPDFPVREMKETHDSLILTALR